MDLWRISIFADLEGLGGERGSGRWHTQAPGKRIVHFAEHPALALVEVLVNLRYRENEAPRSYQLLKISVSSEVSTEQVEESSLPSDWRDNTLLTRKLGDDWLARQNAVLLAVPSAPAPESFNYLFNPNHPEARRFEIAWNRWLRWDKRFFRLSE